MNKIVFLFFLCCYTFGINSIAQENILIKIETSKKNVDDFYFYLEKIKNINSIDSIRVIDINGSSYEIHFLSFSKYFISSYIGCCLYKDQSLGDLKYIEGDISDSIYDEFNYREKLNRKYLNNYFRDKEYFKKLTFEKYNIFISKMNIEYCKCKVNKNLFSYLYDSLIMINKIENFDCFINNDFYINKSDLINNTFISSCLPKVDRYKERKE